VISRQAVLVEAESVSYNFYGQASLVKVALSIAFGTWVLRRQRSMDLEELYTASYEECPSTSETVKGFDSGSNLL